MAKGEKEKRSVLAKPQFFFIIGILNLLLCYYVLNDIFATWPPIYDASKYSVLNIAIPFLLLVFESIGFFVYSMRLMVAKQYTLKVTSKESKIVNVMQIVIFFIGLYYLSLVITGHTWWIHATPQPPVPGQIPVPNR
jgi:hypothetical protein